jgi:hypothetical protein
LQASEQVFYDDEAGESEFGRCLQGCEAPGRSNPCSGPTLRPRPRFAISDLIPDWSLQHKPATNRITDVMDEFGS